MLGKEAGFAGRNTLDFTWRIYFVQTDVQPSDSLLKSAIHY